MDERLEKALAFSNYRVTIDNRKKAIKRRYETMSVVYYNDGVFVADPQTISFIGTLSVDSGGATVLDEKDRPIDIPDLLAFKQTLLEAYHTAMNEYADEMKKLAKARDVKKAMDW
jgi:hypothetical protein